MGSKWEDQGNDEIYNIKTDRNGNIYITGFFESSVMSIGTFTFANTASTKSFIAKYDSNGNVLWVKKPIGFGNDRSESIAIDAAGNFLLQDIILVPLILVISNFNKFCFF
ncbi:MAG: SBBP repeat-containing protein [Bacteroidetes bacterium]|nr:SBBP repeat-containing protein [Bacteroidota bacterium]